MGLSRYQMLEIARDSIRFINVRVRTDTLTATNVLPQSIHHSARCLTCLFRRSTTPEGRPGSSVCIATEYGVGQSGIESRWRRDFPPVQTGPEAHPAYCKIGTGSFPGVKCGRGVLLTTHPLLVPRS